MKAVEDLNLGFTDAQSYGDRSNKSIFSEIFVKNSYLDDLLRSHIYFLIGEKGTGKTAYATFLSNQEYKNNKSIVKFIFATDYETFYNLKKTKNLDLTGYSGIWKVILLLLLGKSIEKKDIKHGILNFEGTPISVIVEAINKYYADAFSPEIITALKVIDESEAIARIIQGINIGVATNSKIEFTETRFQTNLFYIEKQFSDALKKVKLNKNINLFIDGIDIRPDDIPYTDYLESIRGLAHATWILNTELFSNIRDSKNGRLRVVLLLRPDIYAALNLQNSANKLLDNAVILDWRTTYLEYLNSNLYKVANKILSYQQDGDIQNMDIWEDYFKWKLPPTNQNREYDSAFINFLRISLFRPRDILVIMKLLQNKMKKDGNGTAKAFDVNAYKSDEFQNDYSEYFMSSLKDQLTFYYSAVEFNHFLYFFDLFSMSEFTYTEYKENHNKFIDYIHDNADEIPVFIEEPLTLLQLLYDSNTIMAIESYCEKLYFHFSFREKTNANISPKVPVGDNIVYRFHYGLYKKNRFGKF